MVECVCVPHRPAWMSTWCETGPTVFDPFLSKKTIKFNPLQNSCWFCNVLKTSTFSSVMESLARLWAPRLPTGQIGAHPIELTGRLPNKDHFPIYLELHLFYRGFTAARGIKTYRLPVHLVRCAVSLPIFSFAALQMELLGQWAHFWGHSW